MTRRVVTQRRGVEVGQDGQDDDSDQDFRPEDDAEAFDTLD
jgi:hypothetical protein